ncbi:DUF1499 domain-containing protein [Rhodomicrobium sp. Az07]|uniref:DUF1499 domain-containing protein n=1 Tax=Rhodomicrobium sp. Az07 TaxID=2839034 RepID=UPI001BE9FD0C|nr:DUF1499 domain-containing protein [Rhodomicrobium sp. Az07]MBT3071390.1 DUF1499 domain-containing protein [Rhodomicrobium sp. Az07]
MRARTVVAVALSAIPIAIFAALFIAGPERLWSMAGPADQGPVDFETLNRRETPNDSLACPPDTCQARSDIKPPVFAVSAHELRKAFGKAVASEPNLELVDADEGKLSARYVQRSALWRFPDTIEVRFVDVEDGRSTIAIYSRSLVGRGDLGVNKARIQRWIDKLAKLAPVVQVA